MTDYMYIDNVSNPAEKAKMERIATEGVCPFCPENFIRDHDEPIIKEGEYWHLTKNDFPYEGSELHLLLVHKKHIENLADISPEGAKELFSLIQFAEKEFGIDNGLFMTRFGDPHFTGATIKHVHGHLIVSKKDAESMQKLRSRISF